MKTYDPANYIRYVHMDGTPVSSALPGTRVPTGVRLPSGYANQSPLTTLRHRDNRRPPGSTTTWTEAPPTASGAAG